jgi:hypothetical protein
MSRVYSSHVKPDEAAIERNKAVEPEGERLRAELTAWLEKNEVVSVFLDTTEHLVDIQIAKLPPRMKNVLSTWGSIYVKDEPASDYDAALREAAESINPLPKEEQCTTKKK